MQFNNNKPNLMSMQFNISYNPLTTPHPAQVQNFTPPVNLEHNAQDYCRPIYIDGNNVAYGLVVVVATFSK